MMAVAALVVRFRSWLRRMQTVWGRTELRRGEAAELWAAAWLERERGMVTLARNWRYRRAELDLVMRDGPTLVFVEVRLRRSSARVDAFHSVGPGKKHHLRRAARAYVRGLTPRPERMRFDILAIRDPGDGGAWVVEHRCGVSLFGARGW